MNCAHAHELLPACAYGDVTPQQKAALDEHLAACPRCREEQTALSEVGRLLDVAPLPRVPVNVARIFEEAAQRRQRQLRWWRRAVALALGAAAVLLLLFLSNLEVRWENRQLTLRWGRPPEPGPVSQPQQPAVMPRLPPPEVTATDLKLVRDLVHALAAALDERDDQLQKTLALLSARLDLVQDQARQRWAATERYVSALHTSQVESRTKGER
jgi:anti-sigma factor RsiW